MKRILLILTTLLLFAYIADAQNTRDVIYLKNGSVIKGQILEIVPSEKIKIETADGSLFVYDMTDVIKTEKEILNKKPSSGRFNKPKGYFGHVTMSVPYFVVGLDMINGYRFCPEFAMGVGIGVEIYEFSYIGIPIYLHLRSDFLANKVSPYIALDGGIKIGVAPYISPQVGVSYNVGKFRMTTGIEVPLHFFGLGIIGLSPALSVGFSF